jgi:phosphoribosylformylglycinamidine synthase subunit PurL
MAEQEARQEADLHLTLGLTDEEFERIKQVLGRVPNRAELAMYSVMWSEHCSYKSSKIHLRSLPTEGPHVLVGPGEGAGVIEVDGVAVAMRIESHNHPSFVEPVQGAATGIGGVVRDVLSVGARPIALLDSLRFGPLKAEHQTGSQVAERNRFLTEGVVSGISSYGNCIGVPTVGGETKFDPCYSGNPLVNVMCIGVAPVDGLMRAEAPGPGNVVLLLGSSTGRDGIGGVSVLASASFDEEAAAKRPSVQVGDPFTEKLLIEACLSLIEKGLVVGIQDLGGAGLCCAASESAARAGTGIQIDLGRVHRREPGMEPFEVLTSESQERMLVVVKPDDVDAALAECARLGLPAEAIGKVTDTGRLVAVEEGKVVADVPADSLGDGPRYDRPRTESTPRQAPSEDPDAYPDEIGQMLLKLVGSASLSSKRWVWEQYDHQVRLNTVLLPGHDAAVLRIPGTKSRIAITTDGNGRFCQLDPYVGAEHCVAEAFRNLSVVGAEPVAVTNCLNFGNPEDPEVMWQFVQTVRGMREACRNLKTPVTGGNVSFYNQTLDSPIHPTPIIGMVGLIPEGVTSPKAGFVSEDDTIVLLGTTRDELGGSEFQRTLMGKLGGSPPRISLAREASVGRIVRRAVSEGLITSAHDCSEGGIAIALAELCVLGGFGASIKPQPGLSPVRWLFSESPSRVLVGMNDTHLAELKALAKTERTPVTELGTVGGDSFLIEGLGGVSLKALTEAYHTSFSQFMGYS